MKSRMAIISSYVEGETYGLLGPQMAAGLIEEHTPYECIVIGLDRHDDKKVLKRALQEYFRGENAIIGFSNLNGREDLFDFARELRTEGACTFLGGPQADVDYVGEVNWPDFPHRFQGLSKHFSFAIHGPGEQLIPWLLNKGKGSHKALPGAFYLNKDGLPVGNAMAPWNEKFLRAPRWDNLYRVCKEGIVAHRIGTAQILQHIGCPHAGLSREIEIPYPTHLKTSSSLDVTIKVRGCSFCDVATDKGFMGSLSLEAVVAQIRGSPEGEDGRKIPLELINENPLPGLPRLLGAVEAQGIKLSDIHLVTRADWLLKGAEPLQESLKMARRMRIRLILKSVGFESFDDTILRNLNKGLDVAANLRAIELIRRMKRLFPFQWCYSRGEGAIHGFIHPTPWDTDETSRSVRQTILRNRLDEDILPPHSTPLVVHHASALGDWLREIERREGILLNRLVSVIEWWE
jgi:hypothetical protein